MRIGSWKQLLGNLAGSAVVLAVPALALGLFLPRVCAARDVVVTPHVTQVAAAQPVAGQDAVALVEDWTNTFNPTQQQVQQMNNNITQQFVQYKGTFATQSAQAAASIRSKYKGQRLEHYLLLLYKNQSINNILFIQFTFSIRIDLYVNGVISASSFTFRPLING